MKLREFRKLIREEINSVLNELKSQYEVTIYWSEEPAKDASFNKIFGEFLTPSSGRKKAAYLDFAHKAILDLDKLINKLETDKRYSIRFNPGIQFSIYFGDAGIGVTGLPNNVLTTLEKYKKSKPGGQLAKLKKMKASVGWIAGEGASYEVPSPDQWEEYLDNDLEVRVVPFEKGSKEVLEFARDSDASAKEVKELAAKLNQLKTKGNTFVLYAFEYDLNLGVL